MTDEEIKAFEAQVDSDVAATRKAQRSRADGYEPQDG